MKETQSADSSLEKPPACLIPFPVRHILY